MSDDNLSEKTYDELVKLREAVYAKTDEDIEEIEAVLADRIRDRVFELIKQTTWEVYKYSAFQLVAYYESESQYVELHNILCNSTYPVVGKIYRFGDIIVYSKNHRIYMEGQTDNQEEDSVAFDIHSQFKSLLAFVIDNQIKVKFCTLKKDLEEAKSRLNEARKHWQSYLNKETDE